MAHKKGGGSSRNGRDSSNGHAVAQGGADSGILGANGMSASLSPNVSAAEAAADGEEKRGARRAPLFAFRCSQPAIRN